MITRKVGYSLLYIRHEKYMQDWITLRLSRKEFYFVVLIRGCFKTRLALPVSLIWLLFTTEQKEFLWKSNTIQ